MKQKLRSRQNELVLLPLGGTGEIGMNCYCYGLGSGAHRQWLMVDLGVKFGSIKEPGIDVILPDVGYITSNRRDLAGLVLTHAHEDHIGALPWLWPQLECDVYCSAFAAELLTLRLREHGLDDQVPVHVIQAGTPFQVGAFTVELLHTTHSIPQSHALYIKTAAGTVLHSGDWKIDRTPHLGDAFSEKRYVEIGDAGLDAFVCDSTNVLREGLSPSEQEVAATLAEIVAKAKGRVAITTFASHVERISSAVAAARKAGREVVIAGRAMRNTIEAARNCGMLKDAGAFLEEERVDDLPPEMVLLLCTGSQGEPRAALARIAEGSHPCIKLEEGDIAIFSARTIPGNEKEVAAVINNLAALSVDVITADEARVHSSGHPRQGELKQLYEWLRPRALVPMHGEPRHLFAHAKFARCCGIADSLVPRDGEVIRLAPGPLAVVDEVTAGTLHVDGRLVVDGSDGPAKERRKLSCVGIIVVGILIDGRGNLYEDPQVVLDGVPRGLQEELAAAVASAFEAMPRPRRQDEAVVAETIRAATRRAAEMAWGKKPVVKVLVSRV